MNKIDKAKLDNLKKIFNEIHDILVREEEDNWIKGIESIQKRLRNIDADDNNIREKLREISISYRDMNSGQGSFSDFMVWRDDKLERQKLNNQFQLLADRAWALLDF